MYFLLLSSFFFFLFLRSDEICSVLDVGFLPLGDETFFMSFCLMNFRSSVFRLESWMLNVFALSCFLASFCTSWEGTEEATGMRTQKNKRSSWRVLFRNSSHYWQPLIVRQIQHKRNDFKTLCWRDKILKTFIFPQSKWMINVLEQNSSAVHDERTADECHVHFLYSACHGLASKVLWLLALTLWPQTVAQSVAFHTGPGLRLHLFKGPYQGCCIF